MDIRDEILSMGYSSRKERRKAERKARNRDAHHLIRLDKNKGKARKEKRS